MSKEEVASKFNIIPEYKNFEKDFRSLLKPYLNNLNDLNAILNNINIADDPLLVINSYLESKKDDLRKFIRWLCHKFDFSSEDQIIRDFERETHTNFNWMK